MSGGSTVTAAINGMGLPIDSLEQTFAYDGSFVSTITVEYAGITYVQTFTNNGTQITNISQWIPQGGP